MKISKIRSVKTPERGTGRSCGIDFFVPDDFTETVLKPGGNIKIPAGVRVEIPEGLALIAFNKSGVALRGLDVGACVIDEDYQGELNLHMFNVSDEPITITAGMKLTQFILVHVSYEKLELVDDSEMHPVETERGTGGFGSTGVK